MKRLTLIVLLAVLVLATGAVQGQTRYTYTVALDSGESNYLLCAPGGALEYRHPLLADGSENAMALIVVCPEDNAPASPLAASEHVRRGSGMVFLPVIGGTNE